MSGPTSIISENSNVKLGLILVVVGVLGSGFVGAVVWAATIQTKLDTLISNTTQANITQAGLKTDVTDLSRKHDRLEMQFEYLKKEYDELKAKKTP